MVNSLCMMLLYLAANIQKIPLKAKRMGGKVALSGNFNILRAKKVSYKNLCKACHKLFKWVKQHLMITNSISTSYSINIF